MYIFKALLQGSLFGLEILTTSLFKVNDIHHPDDETIIIHVKLTTVWK